MVLPLLQLAGHQAKLVNADATVALWAMRSVRFVRHGSDDMRTILAVTAHGSGHSTLRPALIFVECTF